jgi:CHAD domain-containing protein
MRGMPATTSTGSTTPKPAEPEFPLLGHLDGLMEDLRRRVSPALKSWDVEAIHQARVATRRLKAALDLMRPLLGKRARRPFAKVTRNLRRRLGPLRDVDVMLEHLQELASQGKHERVIGWLSEGLCRERATLRTASTRQGPPAVVLAKLGGWWPVREEMAAARDAVDTLLAESLHLQLDAFAEQADRLIVQTQRRRHKHPPPAPGQEASGAEVAAGAPAAGADGSEPVPAKAIPVPAPSGHQDPHELRISGKALRYTLEMAVVQGHKLPGSVTKRFKRMQEGLGLWHDYVVLADRAMQAGIDGRLGHHDPELTDDLLELVRHVLRRATHHLDKFNRLWASEGETLTKAIRASFPLTRPSPATVAPAAAALPEPAAGGPGACAANEPQTGPGPDDSAEPAAPGGCPPAAPSGA